jgi:ribosomal protein L32E
MSPSSTNYPKSISSWAETTKEKSLIPSGMKWLGQLLHNVHNIFRIDDADQLLKNREIISREIKQQMFEKARDFNINV